MDKRRGRPGVEGVDVFTRPHDWPPYPGSQGQCYDCGFLSRRSTNPANPGVEEVSIEDRKSGELFSLVAGGPSIPWCFVRPTSEVDLLRETEAEAKKSRYKARLEGKPDYLEVSLPQIDVQVPLTLDRKCPEWIWYTQFLSPSEHREERKMLQLEELRQRGEARFFALAIWGLALALLSISATLYPAEMKQGIALTLDWLRLYPGAGIVALVVLFGPAIWLYVNRRGRKRVSQ